MRLGPIDGHDWKDAFLEKADECKKLKEQANAASAAEPLLKSQRELLDSMGQTNIVLAKRLKEQEELLEEAMDVLKFAASEHSGGIPRSDSITQKMAFNVLEKWVKA